MIKNEVAIQMAVFYSNEWPFRPLPRRGRPMYIVIFNSNHVGLESISLKEHKRQMDALLSPR